MIRVTKRGNPPSERIWKGTCRACQSEGEALENELTNITHDQREGGAFSWEKCPVCGAGPYGGMIFYSPRK